MGVETDVTKPDDLERLVEVGKDAFGGIDLLINNAGIAGPTGPIEEIEPDDWRRKNPRFQGENFQRNLDLVYRIEEISQEKGCKPAQLALAWVLAQGEDMVPIPGSSHISHLEENLAALEVSLSRENFERIDEVAPKGKLCPRKQSIRSPRLSPSF